MTQTAVSKPSGYDPFRIYSDDEPIVLHQEPPIVPPEPAAVVVPEVPPAPAGDLPPEIPPA